MNNFEPMDNPWIRESPVLTPAQKAADDLLRACERAAKGYRTMMRLLDKHCPGWRGTHCSGEGLAEIEAAIAKAKEVQP